MTDRLTDEEIEKLRKMLDQDEKVAWLWSMVRRSAAWVFGAAAAVVAFRSDISALFAWLFGKGG